MILHHSGFPIRKSAGKRLFAANRSLSQLVTSFVGSWCQGIRPVLFIAWTFSCSFCLSHRLIIVWNLLNSTMKIPLFVFYSTFRWNCSFPTLQKNLYFFHFICMISIWFCHHFYMLTICSFYSSFALFSFQWSQSVIYAFLVGSSGLEPPTSRLSGARSNHLSYEPIQYRGVSSLHLLSLVEMMGFEPMTPCLQGRCSPSWATPPFVFV